MDAYSSIGADADMVDTWPTPDFTSFETPAASDDTGFLDSKPRGDSLHQHTTPTGPGQNTEIASHSKLPLGTATRAGASMSPSNSPQDSGSDTSRHRKRKSSSHSSPSALFEGMGGLNVDDNFNDVKMSIDPGMLMNNALSPDAGQRDLFDFDSAAASPMVGEDDLLNAATSSNSMNMLAQNGMKPFTSSPGPSSMFMAAAAAANEPSPFTASMFNQYSPSPSAFVQDPSAGLSLATTQMPSQNTWNPPTSHPAALAYSPSPVASNSNSPTVVQGQTQLTPQLPFNLHIDPIPSKSRVETQIPIKLSIPALPDTIARLHLPTHTIAKPKMLAKEVVRSPDTLELSTSLVCTSAMSKPHLRDRALRRAAGEIVNTPRPDRSRKSSSSGSSSSSRDDDPDKPLNGGEVRICNNCINRERKRAARKKVKNSGDEEAWKKHEADRVIVFNTNEYKDWQPWQPFRAAPADALNSPPMPEGTMQVEAPMRIACYCRHQSEKSGFQVIFTLKDHLGNVVAQNMSASILITDDHKTHAAPTGLGEEGYPAFGQSLTFHEPPQQYFNPAGRPYHSHSDLVGLRRTFGPTLSAQQMFHSSKLPSQQTSASMTPRNLSRPASPTGPQAGPAKKRKGSGGAHNRVPSGLMMTSNDQSMSMSQPESIVYPNSAGPTSMPTFNASLSAASNVFGSNDLAAAFQQQAIVNEPPTPNSFRNVDGFGLAGPFSAPTSAHQSRATSPVGGLRSTLASHPRSGAGLSSPPATADRGQQPIRIHKIIPEKGPITGGIEISIHASRVYPGLEILFGNIAATGTSYWGDTSMTCILPAAPMPGPVNVTLRHSPSLGLPPLPVAQQVATFTYEDNSREQLFELALKNICQKMTGQFDHISFAETIVNRPTSWAGPSPGAVPGMQPWSGQYDPQSYLLRCLDVIDQDDSPHPPYLDLQSKNGSTMLSLSCHLGYVRVVAGLLARGVNVDLPDVSGFTPLMKAAMRGDVPIIRRLKARGADPVLRNFQGYTAADFAPNEEAQLAVAYVLPTNQMSGVVAMRPHSRPISSDMSAVSGLTLQSLWDSKAISDYSTSEAEIEESLDSSDISENNDIRIIQAASRMQSRRNSISPKRKAVTDLVRRNSHDRLPTASVMNAWVDQFSTQLHLFQDTLQRNMANLPLPALPNMPNFPDYQTYPVYRRISSLVPYPRSPSPPSSPTDKSVESHRFWDLFSTSTAPPAYSEIYPDHDTDANANAGNETKKQPAVLAAAEAMLDRVCESRYDLHQRPTCGRSSSSSASLENLQVTIGGKRRLTPEQEQRLRDQHARRMKKLTSDRKLFTIWIPILCIILCATLNNMFPQIGQTLIPRETARRVFACVY